jgi:hypothetical protein
MIDIEGLARETGIVTDGMSFARGQIDDLSRFAALVLEAAAVQCEDEHVGQSVNDDCDNSCDRAYNLALRHAVAAIRDMKPGEINELQHRPST